jgi:hypothetical protein
MDKFGKYYFTVSLVTLFFLATFGLGIAVGKWRFWPYPLLTAAQTVLVSLVETGTISPKDRLVKPAADAPRERISISNAESVPVGYYAFSGWEEQDKRYVAWLYNRVGEMLHTWSINYLMLDPDGPSNQSDAPHGLQVLSDGSIVINYSRGDVLARLDTCGQPVWVRSGVFHHMISVDEDGSMWTWRGDATAYGHHQYLLNFDPETGSTIREISFIDDIIRNSDYASMVFGVHPDFEPRNYEKDPPKSEDIFHPNDIETLRSEMARMFPDFEAGDLLLSFRNLDLVTVIDPDEFELKWWSHGPWKYQHDPDFTVDGKISVYNNNTSREYSDIVKIDPSTRVMTNESLRRSLSFYNGWMGSHQYLADGALLVASPGEGRAMVLSETGEKLLEFNNVISADYNGRIQNAVWLPENFFDSMPSCSNTH